MPLKDMATSTAAFVLIRTIGGTVGISIGQAIISSVSPRRAQSAPPSLSGEAAFALSDHRNCTGTAPTRREHPECDHRHLAVCTDAGREADPEAHGAFHLASSIYLCTLLSV